MPVCVKIIFTDGCLTMKRLPLLVIDLLISLFAAVILAAASAFFQPRPWINAWLASGILFWLGFFIGLRIWRLFGSGKTLAILMVVAFLLRLGLGVFLHTGLPALGFDNEVQNAGFVYSDAFTRNTQAFALASSDDSLFTAFSNSLQGDQYGGLLFISASIYRFLSPDAARPLLITILGALFMTIGLAFLFHCIQQRWGRTAALVAGWFYALYPEGVLLGSSQMREPFLIGLFCIGFWAVSTWRQKKSHKAAVFVISIAVAALISPPFGAAIGGLLILYFIIDWLSIQEPGRNRIFGWLLLSVVLIGLVVGGWLWLKPTIHYDAYLTERASGQIQYLIDKLGGATWLIPLTALSGITQPLLPAAILDKSLPIWMTIMSVRAIGWYFAIPFIVFSIFASWPRKQQKKEWLVFLAAITMAAWVCISTLRAGGDQWDNPRYRAILIPWLGWLIGWCWQRIRSGRGAWFFRWLAIEGIFLLGMFAWYLARFFGGKFKIPFIPLSAAIVGLSLLVILSGIVVDRAKARKKQEGTGSIS